MQIDLLFYTDQINGNQAHLTLDEMHHAVNVLRKKVGDTLTLTDGNGKFYESRIVEISKREAILEIESEEVQEPKPFQVRIAIAPTKSFDRMEWCVEKLTEIGITQIIPMLCERSERERWNQERIRKILLSAMKQSKRAYLPECTLPKKFKDVVESATTGQRFISMLHPQSVTAARHYTTGSDVLILIGPEGDFSGKEVGMAVDAGFTPLSLGDFRLRTETAALVAVTTIHALNQL